MASTSESTILERLPDPAAVRERLCELTAERNLLRAILRVYERPGWERELRRIKRREQKQAC
jgi:hypothetical protein